MTKELFIGLIGALVGGLFSLLGSCLSIRASYTLLDKSFKNQQHIDLQRISREHLEELHTNISNLTTYLNTIYLDVNNYFEGKLPKDVLKEFIVKLSEQRKYDMSRIQMIIDIYFTKLKDGYEKHYNAVYDYTLALGKLLSFLKEQEKSDFSYIETFIKEISNYHNLFNETSDELLEMISRIAGELDKAN